MKKLSIKNLTIDYKTKLGIFTAVEDISFEVDDGQSIGIVGESGSGKSTLALALIRSLPENGYVRSGNAIIKGQDVLNMPEKVFDEIFRWKEISMIFQGSMNSLDPVFSIEKQMKEILKVHKIRDSGRKYDAIIKESLIAVGLDPQYNQKIST